MSLEELDLVVLGAGPGGYTAAIRAAQLGRQVTIFEKDKLGGVCLNWGCIPTKALLKSAEIYEEINLAERYGINVQGIEFDFSKMVDRSREITEKLHSGVQYLMKKNKINVLYGTGSLQGDKKLSLISPEEEKLYSYNDIILATGGRPATIPGVNVDGKYVHSSRTLLECKSFPNKLLIVGAGAIGLEFAYLFNALGSAVTVVELQDQLLPYEDAVVARELGRSFRKRGIKTHLKSRVEKLEILDGQVQAAFETNGKSDIWQGAACLVAVGVQPNSDNLGLEAAGIETKQDFVEVDEYLRTNVSHHYAIGDLAGPPLLAHKASHEGLVAAEAACKRSKEPMSYDNIPSCVYTKPEVASIGLTEKLIKEDGLDFAEVRLPFSAVGKAVATDDTEGFVRILLDKSDQSILGIHIIHQSATELISEAVLARTMDKSVNSILNTIHPHPTLSEALVEAAALAAGKPINF